MPSSDHQARRTTLRRNFVVGAASRILGAALLCFSFASAAASFPEKPLKLIVPFAPGAGADAVGRLVARELEAALKQPVVVDNRAGANGVIGVNGGVRSAADGYTVLLVDRSVLGVNPSLYKRLPYDPLKDLEYLGIAAWVPYVLVVHPQVQATSLAELAALDKRTPGKLDYGSFGIGSLPQLEIEALNAALGTSFRHIPYKGAAPAISAAMAGEVQIALSSAASLAGAIGDNRVRPLAVGGKARSSLLPQVPTVHEGGLSDDLLPPTYFGFAVPKGVPPLITDQLRGELRRILQSPSAQAQLRKLGMEPATENGQEMLEVVRRDIDMFGRTVRRLNIQAE